MKETTQKEIPRKLGVEKKSTQNQVQINIPRAQQCHARVIKRKHNKRNDRLAVSENWHRFFYENANEYRIARKKSAVEEGIRFAEEAVTYRLPLPVLRVGRCGINETYPLCPRCDQSLDREYMSYCDCCGQCLDWSMIDYARTCYTGQK